MTIEQLHLKLKDLEVSSDNYYLHGLYGSTNDDNKPALVIKMGDYTAEYEVYFKERGVKYSWKTFFSEKEACEFLLNHFLESRELKK